MIGIGISTLCREVLGVLYISRFVDSADYGVVDSDDGKEEIVDYESILEAYRNGLTIEGVTPDMQATLQAGTMHLERVDIWEGLRAKSQLAVKLYALRGVDIRVYKKCISSLRWRTDMGGNPVEVRLSDFGRICGDRIFFGIQDGALEGKHTITLVFDDKLRLARTAFCFPFFAYSGDGGAGVKFDLREVTDMRIVTALFANLKGYPDSFRARVNCPIIDRPERMEQWHNLFYW